MTQKMLHIFMMSVLLGHNEKEFFFKKIDYIGSRELCDRSSLSKCVSNVTGTRAYSEIKIRPIMRSGWRWLRVKENCGLRWWFGLQGVESGVKIGNVIGNWNWDLWLSVCLEIGIEIVIWSWDGDWIAIGSRDWDQDCDLELVPRVWLGIGEYECWIGQDLWVDQLPDWFVFNG